MSAGSGARTAAATSGHQQQQQQVVTSYPFVPQVSSDFSLDHELDHRGIMKIKRLVFIGERCPQVAVQAFRECLKELKSAQPITTFSITGSNHIATSAVQNLGPNAQLYADVVQRARELLVQPSNQPEHQYFLSAGAAGKVAADPLFAIDQEFHQKTSKNFTEVQNFLENQLLIQKRDGEREQIKVASLNLAEFYLNRGDLNASLNKYLESKEFVNQNSTPQTNMELLNIALNIIKNSILLMNMSHVKTQVQRAQRLWKEITTASAQPSASASAASGLNENQEKDGRIINSKLNAAMGLHHMKGNAYHSAAMSFVNVSSDIQGTYGDVLTGRDVAIYGSICALASFTRKELKDQIIQPVGSSTEFRKILDLNTPNTWKVILQQFYNSNYAKVFAMLEELKHDLYLDLFLSGHVNRLIRQIRERAFIQYFKAYVSVELSVMSVAFNLDMATLERTLAELIQEGKIAARIDSHKKILYARHADQRNDTFTQALQLGNRYVRDVRSLVMRLSLVEHDLAVRSGDSKRKGGRSTQGERDRPSASEEEAIYRAQQESIAMMRR